MIVEALTALGLTGSGVLTVARLATRLEKRISRGFEEVKDQISRSNMEAQIRAERIEGRLDLHEYRISKLEDLQFRSASKDENTNESLS